LFLHSSFLLLLLLILLFSFLLLFLFFLLLLLLFSFLLLFLFYYSIFLFPIFFYNYVGLFPEEPPQVENIFDLATLRGVAPHIQEVLPLDPAHRPHPASTLNVDESWCFHFILELHKNIYYYTIFFSQIFYFFFQNIHKNDTYIPQERQLHKHYAQ